MAPKGQYALSFNGEYRMLRPRNKPIVRRRPFARKTPPKSAERDPKRPPFPRRFRFLRRFELGARRFQPDKRTFVRQWTRAIDRGFEAAAAVKVPPVSLVEVSSAQQSLFKLRSLPNWRFEGTQNLSPRGRGADGLGWATRESPPSSFPPPDPGIRPHAPRFEEGIALDRRFGSSSGPGSSRTRRTRSPRGSSFARVPGIARRLASSRRPVGLSRVVTFRRQERRPKGVLASSWAATIRIRGSTD